MLSTDNHCAGRLAKFPETRRWCLHGAANGIRCLGDVVARTGRWPSKPDFIRMMSHANPAARVELGPTGTMQLAPVARANSIYHHLRRLHDSITVTHRGLPEATHATPPSAHRYSAMVKKRPTPFQLWPKGLIRDLARHAPVQDVAHPMATSTRTSTEDIHRYMHRVRRILRRLPPVHGDVWLRLLYHMLPVNCRFAYLQATNPSTVCCAYNCGAVETDHHALRTCPVVQPLWHLHTSAWGVYVVSFEWITLTRLDNLPSNARAHNDKPAVQLLWQLLAGATLHLIWTLHNAVQYDNRSVPPPVTWAELSFLHWLASVSRWLRLQPPDCPLRASALSVLNVLRWQRACRPLWAKYPSCFRLMATSVTG
ncbi:hypothetical protein ACHHYP_06734 [Achlya hypogyna]|uniref:Uncharacterized protein n=1 Tax=Achlya hypogyna TaxID=1202772 RepID=A0A1V9YSI7_ACHHY|nr:hypothetical protein ACHHYP_06734 [Achlya hypogyna]